jgi:D-aspartate ligase
MALNNQPLALVTGFTIHGLAVARTLSRHGVEVHAFTPPGSRHSPASYTRYAAVHVRDNLNSDALVEHLLKFAGSRPINQQIVLFPTSDRMAAAIAGSWDRLSSRFLLSWAHCRDLVVTLQMKDNLPAFAERSGIRHPRSIIINTQSDCTDAIGLLQLPCIVKPVKPLSAFKALIVRSGDELSQLAINYATDLPFIAQELIDGDEGSLYACTTFLDHGRELCMLTSRKLAASPPGLGQGTIFATESNPEVEVLTRRFLAGLDLSGPVALEFKRDGRGQYWMIEPNVGRTEYCVDLAIQSGIDLPWVEYCHATGRAVGEEFKTLRQHRAWFDTDKDPLCYLHNRRKLYSAPTAVGSPVFPYFGTHDWKPLVVSLAQQAVALAKEVIRPG